MNNSTLKEIGVVSNSLAICDVRCGPTEDKQIIELDSGVYTLDVETRDDTVTITIQEQGTTGSVLGGELTDISIDGGVIGVYDSALFNDKFAGEAESFYEWGESLFDASESIRVYRDSIEPFEFACIPTQLDGVFRVTELVEGDRRVGVTLVASMPKLTDDDVFKAYQFFLESSQARIEVWLDPVYDDESILDTIVDSLEEVHAMDVDPEAAMDFIRDVQKIEFAMQLDEELNPARSLDLSSTPANWNSETGTFCKYLRNVMLASNESLR